SWFSVWRAACPFCFICTATPGGSSRRTFRRSSAGTPLRWAGWTACSRSATAWGRSPPACCATGSAPACCWAAASCSGRWPWRSAVLLLAVLGMIAGVVFLVLFRNTPREHPWANQAEADLVTADDPEAAYARHSRLNWRALLRSPSVGFLCLRSIVSNMADVLYVYWIPLYLRSVKQVTIANTGWMAALPLLGGALG